MEKNQVIEYTPGSVINHCVKSIIGADMPSQFVISGLYQPGSGHSYGGFFFDSLEEKGQNKKIILKVPAGLREKLYEQNIYKLTCSLPTYLRVQGNNIQVTLEVHNIVGVEEQNSVTEFGNKLLGDFARLFRVKASNGYKDFDGIFRKKIISGQKPRILVILGRTAIVGQDIEKGLDGCEIFDLKYYRVNIGNPFEIEKAVREKGDSGNYDAICITRGGGENLEELEDLGLAKAIVGCPVPTVTAIGHAENELFLDYLADKSFPTPTAFGGYLKGLGVKHRPTPTFETQSMSREDGYGPAVLCRTARPAGEKPRMPDLDRGIVSPSPKKNSRQATRTKKRGADLFWTLVIIGVSVALAGVIVNAAAPEFMDEVLHGIKTGDFDVNKLKKIIFYK